VSTAGAGQDGSGVGSDQLRGDAVQVDRHVHHQGRRRRLPAAGRPHRHDAEHVVQSVQETVRGTHHQVGEPATYYAGIGRAFDCQRSLRYATATIHGPLIR